jgi:hypothetical protein
MPACPRCRLVNPPEARRCDCGYQLGLPVDMQTAEMRKPIPRRSKLRTSGIVLVAAAAAVLSGGLIGFRGEAAGFFVLWIGRWVALAVVAGLILIAAGGRRAG